jgi:carboxypeptidase Taq
MEKAYRELCERTGEIVDLGSATAVLGWDQQVYMPPGGAEARGRQMATLGKLAHEMIINPRNGVLLNQLVKFEKSRGYDSKEATIIRLSRRGYEKAVKVPPEHTSKMSKAQSECFEAWLRARPANDFTLVRAKLEKSFALYREYSDFFPGHQHPLDPLIDNNDYGMRASDIRKIFSELRRKLVPMVEAITGQEPADDSFLKKKYDGPKQLEFGKSVVQDFGYDFERGRQDMAAHPFTTSFTVGDVRITTRIHENYLGSALFGTLHEAGHAMYEQGCDPDFDGTLIRGGTSIGVHESQSRLWENIVGRSMPFWKHYYPALREQFPKHLGKVPLDRFYRGINKVQKSLIRVEADEVTYNLHVMMRFDFECDLLAEKMSVSELPDAWNDRMEADLGFRPPTDANGVMQDIHWYSGAVGYFQGYSLGNIMSAQFYNAALKAHPEIATEIGRGKFGTLHGWLRDNIYRHGSKYTANELLERTTGGGLDIGPYMKYLKTKYGELYDL